MKKTIIQSTLFFTLLLLHNTMVHTSNREEEMRMIIHQTDNRETAPTNLQTLDQTLNTLVDHHGNRIKELKTKLNNHQPNENINDVIKNILEGLQEIKEEHLKQLSILELKSTLQKEESNKQFNIKIDRIEKDLTEAQKNLEKIKTLHAYQIRNIYKLSALFYFISACFEYFIIQKFAGPLSQVNNTIT